MEKDRPHFFCGSLALPLLLVAAFKQDHPHVLWNTGVVGEGAWRGAAGGSHNTHHHVT